jgi:inhibitor of cysteine peptidase
MNIIIGSIMSALSLIVHADTLSVNVEKKQSSFVVRLAANPTTGFQWSVVSYDKELFTLSASSYQKPSTKLIGAGGHSLFTFTLKKGYAYPKSTALVFKYARPWENKGGSIQNVTVNFGTM